MTCTECGEKPKNDSKHFTKTVVEINNPEKRVLLRKVVVPASMGTEDEYPASVGKFFNVVLAYEANEHVYIYSSDGIPTLISREAEDLDELWTAINQEIANRIAEGAELSAAINSISSSLSAETTAREQADTALGGRVTAIEEKIPAQASVSNQLADKNFVNSSVATNTANYISNNGQPFNSLAELEAYSGTLTNNDYAFVVGTDQAGNTTYTRYKYVASSEQWAEEYVLNNSSFTANQWATINSGITSGDATKIQGLANIQTIGTGLALANGELSATSPGPTVVQTTGTSTTDVMSQNAVTDALASAGAAEINSTDWSALWQ